MKSIALLVMITLVIFISSPDALSYTPFWDFRQWDTPQKPIYREYMSRFAQQGITALVLMNKDSLPPFDKEQKFLADAGRFGVNVWLRTNRVTPKRGIPGRPNGTLDFALDADLQQRTLKYLDNLAALSMKYPQMKGLIIGGEEIVGARISTAELSRWDSLFYHENGFHMTGTLTSEQKMQYFDWVQRKNNLWYAKIWDYLHTKYPSLNLFIYPDSEAFGEGKLSKHPRPAYWDIFDLIVIKKKKFKIIAPSYNIRSPLGAWKTAAESAYLRDAVQGHVPFHVIVQGHKTEGQRHEPTGSHIESHIFAALVNGASGIGFWATDMDNKKDIYDTNRNRWETLFRLIETGRQYAGLRKIEPDVYVLRPRYTAYVADTQTESSLDIFAELYRGGFFPGFILDEQARMKLLPTGRKVVYIPASRGHERPDALHHLVENGMRISQNDTIEHFMKVHHGLISQSVASLAAGAKERIHVLSAPVSLLLCNPGNQSITLSIIFMGTFLQIPMSPESLVFIDVHSMEQYLSSKESRRRESLESTDAQNMSYHHNLF